MSTAAVLLSDVAPEFARELESALRDSGDDDLADQVSALRVIDTSGCGDYFCASFYTDRLPEDAWGAGHEHENVVPDVRRGMVILDVVDRVIRFVEALYRYDVRRALHAT